VRHSGIHTLKSSVAQLVEASIAGLPELAEASASVSIGTTVERTRDARHGDFTTNIAMRLAKSVGKNPREIAQTIIDGLPASDVVAGVEIAGPGFVNFRLSEKAFHQELETILDAGAKYGRQPTREEPSILLEFVSANPTGPLHVGHGRHASFGATLGNLLEAAGCKVDREYYVNDAGRQMDILCISVLLRALEAGGASFDFPEAGYRGDYIRDIAGEIDASGLGAEELFAGTNADDKEAEIGGLIENAEKILGIDRFHALRRESLESILDDIKDDLAEFGVTFDRWFSEDSLTDDNLIDDALAVLKERGMLYEKEGATWFRATDYGDEKDRVVVRDNGKKTYFTTANASVTTIT
jgi:arginyl-tRNA synthetase